MRAVGIVTQTGAYFFLAAGVPRSGSSAMATLAMEHAAAAAAAKIKSLLPLLLSSLLLFISTVPFSASGALEAWATMRLRRGVEGLVMVEARNEAVMVMEAISSAIAGYLVGTSEVLPLKSQMHLRVKCILASFKVQK